MPAEASVDTARADLPPGAWESLTLWIKLYLWAQVAFLTLLVGSLHFFPLIGKQWSSCLAHGTGATDWWCVLFFHLYEIPFVVLFAYHAYFGFAQITRAKLPYYTFLTLFQVVMLIVFLTFESNNGPKLSTVKDAPQTFQELLDWFKEVRGLVILAVVSALAGGGVVSTGGVIKILIVAVGFLVAAVIIGSRVAPRIFDQIERIKGREIVVVFGGCVGMIVNSVLGFYVVFARVLPAYLVDRQRSA